MQNITKEVKKLLEQELIYMKEKDIKDLAWNTFKQTGDINTFIEFKQVENIEKNGAQIKPENVEGMQYGNYQNQRNHSF